MYRVINRTFHGTESVYLTRSRADAISAFIAQAFYPAPNARTEEMVSWGLASTGSYSASSKERGMVRVERMPL